ncbi:MAG: L,D-transpeptidase [Acidimicrobiales bacterium]
MAPVHGFAAAQSNVSPLEVFAEPASAAGTAPVQTLANPTWEGYPLVLSIIDTSDDGRWYHARLPVRPNGSTGWIRAADVTIWDVPNRIVVDLTDHLLTVFAGDSDQTLLSLPVGVGRGSTPTPVGDFYIDIVNPLGGHRVYGWGQLSVAGFSEVYQSFGGGIGQIALHGWNNPNVVGDDVSNGCVRMRNEDIAALADLAPLGTPVSIVE